MAVVAFFLDFLCLGKFLVPHCCDLVCLVFIPVFGANMKKVSSPGVLQNFMLLFKKCLFS
jgi:hypothetical protein